MKNLVAGLLLIVLICVSCDEKADTCKEQSARLIQFNFYKSVAGLRDSVLRSFDVSMKPSGFNKSAIRAPRITLPLLQSADSTVYSVTINKINKVELTIHYKRQEIFENYKCGYRYDFIVDRIVSVPQFCDSIVIIQPYVTDVNQENCRFYFSSDSLKYQ